MRSGDFVQNRTAAVDQFLDALEHPVKDEIAAVRLMILESNSEITERIKWNAPSFCYLGDDRVTFRLHPPRGVQLIFHRGAKVKDTTNFSFTDDTGLMNWVAQDRGTVTMAGAPEVEQHGAAVVALVNRWMLATCD